MSAVVKSTPERDSRVEAAISHWAPRFVANGVPLADFQEVTASVLRWEDWCTAWSARAAIHEELGNKALAGGHTISAGEHFTRAAVCYHFGKFLFVNDMAQMREAHRRAVECRNKALPYLLPPGERVAIDYEGKKLYGNLLVTVSIKSDGSVDRVEINRPSGHRILDAAVLRIVQLAAPFAAFPPDIARDTDILSITRVWTFTRSDQLVTE